MLRERRPPAYISSAKTFFAISSPPLTPAPIPTQTLLIFNDLI